MLDSWLKPGLSLSREAEPVEDESPLREENAEEEEEEERRRRRRGGGGGEEEEEIDEEGWGEMEEEEEDDWENEENEETPITSEEGESPPHLSEEGSGGYEGSADAFVTLGDIGSGESWTEEGMDVVGESQSSESQAKPAEQELREEHLLSP
ncbi:hypothetical protein D4764_02G0003030 [Takifugu flavidus]|uniref:Uncharacterized protein n=1 Tax=Takifugu flavidus TaxID=433684 RepID=A0A5C6NI31_9TELE|nr:hypothetical protein D4764_02G0003030 [Takifugu flavidus]